MNSLGLNILKQNIIILVRNEHLYSYLKNVLNYIKYDYIKFTGWLHKDGMTLLYMP